MDPFEWLERTAERERIRFNGIVYRRYPQAKQFSDRSYFRAGIADRKAGYSVLHRDMYSALVGPIPIGWEVHHKNGKALENRIDNFEPLPVGEHRKRHEPGARQRSAIAFKKTSKFALLVRARRATRWHGSPEGLAWHSQHAKKCFAERQPLARICDQCGSPFDSISRRESDRFCSGTCKTAWRRKAGLDDEERTCENCGAGFTVNKYIPKRFCTQSCSLRHWHRAKGHRLQPESSRAA